LPRLSRKAIALGDIRLAEIAAGRSMVELIGLGEAEVIGD